jgi:hypothetical protein
MDVRPEEAWATHLRDKVYEIISCANCPVLTLRTKPERDTTCHFGEQPGDSAVYALLRTANPGAVTEQFRGYGGTILSTTLSRDQQK